MGIRTGLRKFDWKGWLGWMAATMAGAQLVGLIIFFYFAADRNDHWWGDLAMVSVVGISLGVCQWIWLRRRLVKAWWWIVSTLLGWYLAAPLVKMLGADDSNATGALSQLVALIELLAIPLAFSLPQWFLIRRQFKKAAWWWVVARPLAWVTGLGRIVLGDWLNIVPVGAFAWFPPHDLSDLVLLSMGAATFGFGFATVTGVAFTRIQANHSVVSSYGAAKS